MTVSSGTAGTARTSVRLGRPFWRLWSATAVADLADGVLKVTLPLAAARLTDSPALVALMGVALTAPWLVVSLPAGAVVDRADRRRAMVLADGARIAVLAGLVTAAAAGVGSIGVLCAGAALLGVADTVHDTAAQAVLPQVVERPALARANSRLQAVQLTANEFAGPPLGGLLVAGGLALAFAAPAALWGVAGALLLLLPGRFRVPRASTATLRADIAEGLRFLVHHRVLRALAAMTGTANLPSSAAFAVFVLYAVGPRSTLRLTGTGYGLLVGGIAVGSAIGALAGERLERRIGRSPTLLAGLLLSTAWMAAPAATTGVPAIAVGFLVGGLGNGLYNVVGVSLRQRLTPDRVLGRVTSAYRLLAWGTQPLGAALGGAVAEAFGLRVVFAGAAGLALVTALGVTRTRSADITAAEAAAGG